VPLGLVLDPDGLRDAVDVVEERDHLDRVVDRLVAEPGRTQPVDLALVDRRRLERQVDGEVAEREEPCVEAGRLVVVGRVSR